MIYSVFQTAANYEEAIRILRSRYGNKQALISVHIDKLLNLTPVISSKEIKSVRGLHDEIEINVRSLKNLDIASSHYGPILISIVMSKLPDDIKLIVSRTMASVSTKESDKEWKIDKLIRILKQEIESREMCYFVTNSSEKPERPHKKVMPGIFTSSSLITAANEENPYSCVYCGKNHASWKCFMVTDVGSRKTILRKKGRCFLCLQSNHISILLDDVQMYEMQR